MTERNHHLHSLRREELELAMRALSLRRSENPGNDTILEVGAGTGHQARLLAELGFEILALEVPGSAYRHDREFPIIEYDGTRVPVKDKSVKIVYSSNVLEHVVDLNELLRELKRVMTDDGWAVHILPTTAWRFWTLLGHYGWLIRRVFSMYRNTGDAPISRQGPSISFSLFLLRVLFPGRHGERGNTLTELYYFSERFWKGVFQAQGYEVVDVISTGIFYSGASILGDKMSLKIRKRLAPWLGSACRVYFLKNAD